MAEELFDFDVSRAKRFRSRAAYEKVAVLVDVVDAVSETIVHAPFGQQTMVGPFYIVAEGGGSYAVARSEFEATHRLVGECRWVKEAEVFAYQLVEAARIMSRLSSGHLETEVRGEVGDWVIWQPGGELTVATRVSFESRYESM